MTSLDELSAYQYLWDGSAPGWVLLHISHIEVELSLQFSSGGPSPREIMAMRRTIEQFKEMPLERMREQLAGMQTFRLGLFESAEARTLAGACRSAGLTLLDRVVDHSGYLLKNEIVNRALLIEDDNLSARVHAAAVQNGMPVRYLEF